MTTILDPAPVACRQAALAVGMGGVRAGAAVALTA